MLSKEPNQIETILCSSKFTVMEASTKLNSQDFNMSIPSLISLHQVKTKD